MNGPSAPTPLACQLCSRLPHIAPMQSIAEQHLTGDTGQGRSFMGPQVPPWGLVRPRGRSGSVIDRTIGQRGLDVSNRALTSISVRSAESSSPEFARAPQRSEH